MDAILGSALEVLRIVSILVVPAMPSTAGGDLEADRPDGSPADQRLPAAGDGVATRGSGRGKGCPAVPTAQGLSGGRRGDAVIEWFDSHCHLQEEFAGADGGDPAGPHADPAGGDHRPGRRGRCVPDGVRRDRAGSSAEAVALVRAMRRPGSVAVAEGVELWATVGLHPHDAVDGVDCLDALLAAELGRPGPRRGPVVVGIGECGLDYHYDHSPRPVQREAFARQVELAHRHHLALVVHTREAWDDTVDILAAAGVPERTIIHCFTGGPEEARRCLDIGASLSFSGVVTFKNAADVREAAALCPLDRLLVETDSPFLTPVPHGGPPTNHRGFPWSERQLPSSKGLRLMSPRWHPPAPTTLGGPSAAEPVSVPAGGRTMRR